MLWRPNCAASPSRRSATDHATVYHSDSIRSLLACVFPTSTNDTHPAYAPFRSPVSYDVLAREERCARSTAASDAFHALMPSPARQACAGCAGADPGGVRSGHPARQGARHLRRGGGVAAAVHALDRGRLQLRIRPQDLSVRREYRAACRTLDRI